MVGREVQETLEGLAVLIADGNQYMRRLTRMMLGNIGIRSTYEASDGIAAIEGIRAINPSVLILDWELPILDGREVMRIVRTPGVFPRPNLPVIMTTGLGLRSRVTTSIRLGAHELLVKPMSAKSLQLRLLGIMLKPRPMVRAGKYYIPMPRRRVDLQKFLAAA
jgi:two-component system chemotaxis response regulator CheY